jgi:hypothetical protein
MTAYAGQRDYADGATDFGQLQFVIKQMIGRTATATLVQIKAVTNDGGVSPVGFVDVNPLVAQLDGNGQPTPHGIIHNVPYLRLQGGTNAVIIDPVVGDIGIAVFASRDISSVKKNKAPSNPGSRRKFSMADALYIGGVLNGVPANYIRFTSTGDIELKPATMVTVMGDLVVTGDVLTGADGISSATHTHSDSGAGPPNP